ncbi:MAG: helix-hairpin-helix domain-containing protein [Acidobacteriota bacterium]|nr:MAG: helix-hairpin-helix domain-containing protein [Acidobacteriota bacterium]
MKRELLTFPLRRTIFLVLLACLLQAASSCVQTSSTDPQPEIPEAEGRTDINAASVEELAALPGIGEATARKIVAHRQTFGEFRRKEHLLLVEGISEKKYLAMRDLITAGPKRGAAHREPEGHSSRGTNGSRNKDP